MLGLQAAIEETELDPWLLDMVALRASQINGCAFCIDVHRRSLEGRGESAQRLASLDSWEGTGSFTKREQAVLAWTAAVTLVSAGFVPDELYQEALKYFTKEELVNLTFAIAAINAWNRLNVSFRRVPGGQERSEFLETAELEYVHSE
jgi:AhpD family alkylhydroperoxidase